MDFPYSIAFCCNGSLLPGLHAALGSLTQRLGAREKVALYVFTSGVDDADQEALRETVIEAGGVGHLEVREVDLADFRDFKTLHGDRTAYLRLKLPVLVPDAQTIVYLDSDLVVHTDVCEMFALPLGDAPLGAAVTDLVQWSGDRESYLKLGLAEDDRCINSGVLLINAAVWRETRVTERAIEYAQKKSDDLKSHDQTILTVFFSRSLYVLTEQYNRLLTGIRGRVKPDNQIYHFMGSPKPWDPLGSLLHSDAHLWQEAIKTTRFRWSSYLARYGRSYFSRTWALRRSYGRMIFRRLRWLLWRRFFGKPS